MMELTPDHEHQLDAMFWNLIDQGGSARDAEQIICAFARVLADARIEETGEDDPQ